MWANASQFIIDSEKNKYGDKSLSITCLLFNSSFFPKLNSNLTKPLMLGLVGGGGREGVARGRMYE